MTDIVLRPPTIGDAAALASFLQATSTEDGVGGVDAASPTGATRLYERAGMHVLKQFSTYEKEL